MTIQAKGYAAQSATSLLDIFTFERRDPRPNDVLIDVLFSGICHSDIHSARNEWGGTQYPIVPGHEIVGRVKSVGGKVTKFKAGDLVGVGCLVDSCRTCPSCNDGLEQYCDNGWTGTYNSQDKIGGTPHKVTLGGYSDKITVDERFVLRIPENLDPAAAAPLLCAGITTYSPLKHWKVGQGHKVGVIGLGGLGGSSSHASVSTMAAEEDEASGGSSSSSSSSGISSGGGGVGGGSRGAGAARAEAAAGAGTEE